MKLKEWEYKWLDYYMRHRIKQHTYARYREIIDLHIVPIFGETELTELSTDMIQAMVRQKLECGNLRDGGPLSSNSVNAIIVVLKSSLSYACEMELLPRNPCDKVRRALVEEKKVEAFTLQEQKKIENYCVSGSDDRTDGIMICLYTGIRIGELLSLKWEDIDLHKGIMSIRRTVYRMRTPGGGWQTMLDKPKTKSSLRDIPLPGNILKLLRDRRRRRGGEYVVCKRDLRPIAVRSYQFIFSNMLLKLKIRTLGFHSLRHTFATRALESGMDIKTLSELMGHKNASITMNRYAHSLFDTKRRAMNKLSSFVK